MGIGGPGTAIVLTSSSQHVRLAARLRAICFKWLEDQTHSCCLGRTFHSKAPQNIIKVSPPGYNSLFVLFTITKQASHRSQILQAKSFSKCKSFRFTCSLYMQVLSSRSVFAFELLSGTTASTTFLIEHFHCPPKNLSSRTLLVALRLALPYLTLLLHYH